MNKTILVAVDFSPVSNNALEYAMQAAKEINATVVIFHLFKLSSHVAHSLVTTKELDQMLINKKRKHDQYVNELSNKYGVATEAAFRMGDFQDEIKLVIEKFEPFLVVFGMPKKTFEQDLLGNTTTATIYNLKFPILTIPEGVMYKGIKHIIYAWDLKKGVDPAVLNKIKDYANLYNASVEILYVGKTFEYSSDTEKITEILSETDHYFKNVSSNTVIKSILKEAEEMNADILIMAPNKNGFWSSLVLRSKTRAMASNGKIPLLSLAK